MDTESRQPHSIRFLVIKNYSHIRKNGSDSVKIRKKLQILKLMHYFMLSLLNGRFSIYERKHHCRNCGLVYCNKCSRFESEISRLRILKPVRVCQQCYATLRQNSVDSQ